MEDFIAKYWLEVLFGLIVTGLSVMLRRIWKLYKDAQQKQKDEDHAELLKEVDKKIQRQENLMQNADEKLIKQIRALEKEVKTISCGILSIQGDSFRRECKHLLEPGHIITIEEFEQITHDHQTYNELGGNHIGDKFFNQVEKKFQSQINI